MNLYLYFYLKSFGKRQTTAAQQNDVPRKVFVYIFPRDQVAIRVTTREYVLFGPNEQEQNDEHGGRCVSDVGLFSAKYRLPSIEKVEVTREP